MIHFKVIKIVNFILCKLYFSKTILKRQLIHICEDLFLHSLILLIPLIFLPVPHCPDYLALDKVLTSSNVNPLTPFFVFQIIFAILGPLPFHLYFRISLPISTKNPARTLLLYSVHKIDLGSVSLPGHI